jgi:hypothetical protein
LAGIEECAVDELCGIIVEIIVGGGRSRVFATKLRDTELPLTV